MDCAVAFCKYKLMFMFEVIFILNYETFTENNTLRVLELQWYG